MVNLTLGVNEVYDRQEDITICDGTSYAFGTQTLTEVGSFTETFQSALGCDSTVNLNLTLAPNTLSPMITVAEEVLTVDETNVNYQWIDCITQMPISNEIGQSFLVTENGDYAVVVTDEYCQATSDCETIEIILAVGNEINGTIVELYPNPTRSDVIVKFVGQPITGTYEVSDINGRKANEGKLVAQKEINLSINGKAGIYLLKIVDAQRSTATYRLGKE